MPAVLSKSQLENRCDICNITFTWPKDLKRHKKECHRRRSSRVNQLRCPHCNNKDGKISFLTERSLKQHISCCPLNPEHKQFAYQCDECPKSYAYQSQLIQLAHLSLI